jgi:hypothetical protein
MMVGSSPGFFFSPMKGTNVSIPDIQSTLQRRGYAEAVNFVFDKSHR